MDKGKHGFTHSHFFHSSWGRGGGDRMVVEFTTTCAISAYYHKRERKIGWLGIRIMCPSGATSIRVSVSGYRASNIKIQLSMLVVHSGHHYHLIKCNLFTSREEKRWGYRWQKNYGYQETRPYILSLDYYKLNIEWKDSVNLWIEGNMVLHTATSSTVPGAVVVVIVVHSGHHYHLIKCNLFTSREEKSYKVVFICIYWWTFIFHYI
jgi:hypothetical protein